MKVKRCSKCTKIKTIDSFIKDRKTCIECKEKYEENKNIKKDKDLKSLEKIKICSKCYFEGSGELFTLGGNICLDCRSEYAREYRNKNKEKIKKEKKLYIKNRRKQDKNYSLRKNISSSIWRIIKDCGGSKNGKSILTYLPYTIEQLKQHLEQQFEWWMTWENYGNYKSSEWKDGDFSTYKWSLDHIIPQSDLLYDSMDHPNFKKAWILSNLRPLSAKQNSIEGATKIRHKNNKRNRK